VGASTELPCEKPTGNERGGERVAYRFDCVRFVSFEDITDPLTVFAVDRHDAAATVGEGYAIKAITVTITDEDITTGIEKRLPLMFFQKWAEIHKREMKRGGGVMNNPYFSSLAGSLSRTSFTTENPK